MTGRWFESGAERFPMMDLVCVAIVIAFFAGSQRLLCARRVR